MKESDWIGDIEVRLRDAQDTVNCESDWKVACEKSCVRLLRWACLYRVLQPGRNRITLTIIKLQTNSQDNPPPERLVVVALLSVEPSDSS